MKQEEFIKNKVRSMFQDAFNPNFDADKVSEARLMVCRPCEFFTKDKVCSKCGCMMEVKTKLSKEKCPIGKWDAL